MPELPSSTSHTAPSSRTSTASTSSATGAPSSHALTTILQQLQQSLTVLSSAAELVIDSKATSPAAQPLRVWLQPNARQAEAALHRLREFRILHLPAATELIQCLTVLVLAADMLIQGHLSDGGTLENYQLLRRNADRAMRALNDLREQLLRTGVGA